MTKRFSEIEGDIWSIGSVFNTVDQDKNNDVQSSRILDGYEKSIFCTGETEIHFNAHVDLTTITRFKKLISIVVDKNKDKLVKYEDGGKVPSGRASDQHVVITYIVNSPGGDVHACLDFVDYIGVLRSTYCNIRFTSVITGMVASAGTIMCVIADNRQMTRFAFAMIHELSTGLSRTNYTRVVTHAEFIQKLHKVLVDIYQESRMIDSGDKNKLSELEDLLLKETWMSAEEYKGHGFVDEIIGGTEIKRRKNN